MLKIMVINGYYITKIAGGRAKAESIKNGDTFIFSNILKAVDWARKQRFIKT